MDYHLQILKATRKNLLGYAKHNSLDQLNTIPEGYNNNIIWNLGHILVTHQLLCYGLTGQPFTIPEETIEKYRKGTKPENPVRKSEVDFITDKLISELKHFEKDFHDGKFQEFTPYSTSYGIDVNTFEEAVIFNNAHEAMHLGTIMALRKLV